MHFSQKRDGWVKVRLVRNQRKVLAGDALFISLSSVGSWSNCGKLSEEQSLHREDK